MNRIGIFAGTFDPVHEGHISFALAAKDVLQLDTVYFLIENAPRDKQNVSDLEVRETKLKNALSKNPGLATVSLEDDRFSVMETMPKLEKMFPDTPHFTFLLGSDVATHSLPYWEHLEMLLPDVSFAIGIRALHNENEVLEVIDRIAQQYGPIDYKIIPSPHPDISSTQVRT